jgi:hypothetical protein
VPDFGLTEALAGAMKGMKDANFVRAPEAEALARAGKGAPAGAAAGAQTPAAPAIETPAINPDMPTANVPQPPAPDLAAISTPTPEGAPPTIADAPVAPPIDDSAPAPGVTPPNPEVPTALPGDAIPGQTAVEAAGAAPKPGADVGLPQDRSPAEDATTADAQRFVTANMGDFSGKLDLSHMPNTDTMATPEGMKAAILQVADDNADAINTERRGTISNEQLLGLAQDMSIKTDVAKQVLQRELGTQLDKPETVLAARLIEQNALGQIIAGPAAKIVDGSATSADVLAYAQQKANFVMYHQKLAGAMTEQGRGTNAMGIKVGSDLPQAVIDHIAQVYRDANPDLEAEANAVKLATSPNGVALILARNTGSLMSRVGTAARSLVTRVFVNGILSGPPTWAKIFIGNNFNLVKTGVDIFNAGLTRNMIGLAQRMGRFPTSAEGAQMSDAFTYAHGVIAGGMDAFRLVGRTLKTGVSLDNVLRFDPAEVSGVKNVNPALGVTQSIVPEITGTWFGALAKGLDTFIELPGSRAIGATDEFSKTLGARGYRTMMTMREIRGQLQDGTLQPGDAGVIAKKMFENPDPSMLQAEEDFAHRITFQSPFPEGGPGEAFSNFITNKVPALKFIFPFMRTANNIFKQGMVETGPLAALSSRLRNQLAAGGFEADMVRGRITTALQFGGGLAWMAIHDQMTGEAPKDPKERALWASDGRTPNSMKVTNPLTGATTWHSYAWMEPMASFASAIGSSASVWARVHQDEELNSLKTHADMIGDMTTNIVGALIAHFANASTMTGATKFAEMFDDPEKGMKSWATDFGTSMVPYSKAIEFARNVSDPYLREAWSLHDKIMNDLPGKSKDLGVATDLFGQPRPNGGPLGRMSPFPSSPVGADDVTDELHALMDHTHTVPITMPSRQVSMGGGVSGRGILGGSGLPLTSQEYSEMVQKGRAEPNFDGGTLNLHDKLSQVMQSPTYYDSTPAERSAMVSLYATQADKFGRERLYNENDSFRERLTQWASEKNGLKVNQ